MPRKRRVFAGTSLSAKVLEQIATQVRTLAETESLEFAKSFAEANGQEFDGSVPQIDLVYISGLEIQDNEEWVKYELPAQFYNRLNRGNFHSYVFRTGTNGYRAAGGIWSVDVNYSWTSTTVEISHPDETVVDQFMGYFMDAAEEHRLPETKPAPPRIFIGHGGSPAWHSLHTYLRDVMKLEVEAYETHSRAGYDIKEVLESAIHKNQFALIVMTAEDEQSDGGYRARQNVVHEVGLFQGALGFHRAIVVLENGAEEFSNIAGVNQLRFPPGNINAVYGDVIAALKREFGDVI